MLILDRFTWLKASPAPCWRLKYFHRCFITGSDYKWDYMVTTYYLRWRFTLWVGKKLYHLVFFLNFTPFAWRIKK